MIEDVMMHIAILEVQIDSLPKGLTPKQRRKTIGKWTFENRKANPEAPYWEVLNSGNAGNTLAMAPTKSQKLLYDVLKAPGSKYSVLCDFKEDLTIITITEIPKAVKYKLEIPY